MQTCLPQTDCVLSFLGRLLTDAALSAKAKIALIPHDISVRDECLLIDAASAGAVAIAEQIVALTATLAEACEIREKAEVWLDFGRVPI